MGFFEILLIAIVALFVVGPERMPEAVRSVALTIGRIKRSFNSARTELEKQIGTDDIRRQLHNESVMESLGQIKDELSDIDKKIDSSEMDMSWKEDEYDYGPNHHHNDTAEDDEPNTVANHATESPRDKPSASENSWQNQPIRLKAPHLLNT